MRLKCIPSIVTTLECPLCDSIRMGPFQRIGTVAKWNKFNKYLAMSRNAIVVVLGTLTAFLLDKYHNEIPFAITGNVASGLPTPSLPPFSTTHNGTEVPFTEMLKNFGGALVTIPFVAILEIFAIAKAFGKFIVTLLVLLCVKYQ